MANAPNSPRRGSINLGVYILVAVLAVTIGIASFMPYSALIMVVPGFLLALGLTIFWIWGTAFFRARAAWGRRGAAAAALEMAATEPIQASEPEPQTTTWPGVTMGEEYLAVRLSDLLRELSDAQAESIFKIARWETLPAGTRMATAGAQAEWIYVIADGAVQLTGRSGLGEVTVRVAREGEAFPLAALLGSGELVTSAKAATDVSVLAVSRTELLNICSERPDIGMTIFRTTAEILADRYRSTLRRHLEGAEQAVRQSDVWANV